MNLKPLSDSLLLSKTKSLVHSERQLLTEILHHLREVERRKLFSDLGYSSLFDYAVRELGYSEGQAGRRIQAMRLLRELPQLEEKVESGALNLSHLSQAQSYFREAKKAEKPIEPAAKLEIIEKLESKSAREAQKILLELSPRLAIPKERERVLTPELSEVRFVMSEELKEKLERVKALLGPKALGLGLAELIGLMAEHTEEALKKKKFGPHLGKSEKARCDKLSVAPSEEAEADPQTQRQTQTQSQTGSHRDAGPSCQGKVFLSQQAVNPNSPDSNVVVKMKIANSNHAAPVSSELGTEMGKTHSVPGSSNNSNDVGADTRAVSPSRRSSASSRDGGNKEVTHSRCCALSSSKVGAEVVGKQAVTKHPSSAKSPRYIPRSVKAQVWQRDQGQCSKCGSRRNLNFDHIKPLALGGESTASNLRLLCFHCNQRARMKTFGPRGAESSITSPFSTSSYFS